MKNDLYEQRIKIISAFLIATFIGLFNETALNMAFVQLIADFNSDAPTIQWLTTGYLLTLGVLVPISAILMQRFTTRQLFVVSLVFSIVGTIIAAISPTFIILLLGRIIQAAGTAIILPVMMQVVLLVYPINKRGAAMGKIGLVIIFAPAIGPTIAGLVIDQLSWHFIFWLSLPFLVFSLLFGLRFVQNVGEVKIVKFDILSIILSSIGFGGIVYGFSISGKLGTFMSTEVLVSIGIGLLSLVLFGFRQTQMEQPMLNLRVFTFRMFSMGVTIIMICMMMILSTMVLLPIYLQNILLLTPVIAGVALLPGGVINAFVSVLAGNMFDRFGPRFMVPGGLLMSIVALFALRTIDGTTSIYFIIAFHIIMFIGITLTMMPAQTNGLNQLPRQLYPDGTAIMNTLQQVAGAIGTAVAITIMSISTANYVNVNGNTVAAQLEGSIQGVQNSITFGLIIAIIGFLLSLLLTNVRQGK
ncbi:multidrug efflux MFS transporter [Sporosarcina sp. E16_3]|uniref:MDR family MFS transporter n=1 Tax=Sporosarcina sp. E16_3 TaxID=2789293 RepID=UPI001A928CA4|nr:MDR family MFS transporter [Sporosarcina sp. E16_3]MBO0600195.1 multidrug efflux MFS transporter [Sporosarcina sp. E16_3]